MEWGKIKSILICIFAVVNIFLLYVYFGDAYTGKSIDSDMILNAVKIINENNIDIEEDIIPKTYENARICTVENKFKDANDILEYIWNEYGENVIFGFNKNNVKIKNNTFECELDISKNNEITKNNIERELEKCGLLNFGKYSKSFVDNSMFFYMEYEGMSFFDSYIRVDFKDDKPVMIYGTNWLFDKVYEDSTAKSISPIEILVDFASEYSGNKVEITGMQSGYYIGERNATVKVTATPVWEIRLSDGEKYYYDMRTGNRY